MDDQPDGGLDPRTDRPAREALASMVAREPDRHPLVIAMTAPVGTRLEPFLTSLERSLRGYGYATEHVTLSGLLDAIQRAPWGRLPGRGQAGYYQKRMDAGDTLRQETGSGAALAALAVARVATLRPGQDRATAYLLRSLKHPDEVELLRHVYGDALWLVAVVSDPGERREDFGEALTGATATFDDPRAEAERLIARDEADEEAAHGQHVRDVFAVADAFLPSRRGHDCGEDVRRLLEGVFGAPFLTPRPAEEAMRLSADASLRSAAVGRQVGAVLVARTGTTYVAGTNEVPRPGGGQFWAGDVPDHRDFRTGDDPNPAYTARMLQELFGRLGRSDWLRADLRGLGGDELLARARQPADGSESLLAGARAAAVLEFTRCLHAEQAAIVNAARQGLATEGASLYTTTFPCHECAKFIVGAGVREVVYVEPFPKSLVRQLYRDLIDTRPPLPLASSNGTGGLGPGERVPFHPFVGFSPRRYGEVFVAGQRRVDGGLADFDPGTAHPRTGGWSEAAVAEREAVAASAVTRLVAELFGAQSEPAELLAAEPAPGPGPPASRSDAVGGP